MWIVACSSPALTADRKPDLESSAGMPSMIAIAGSPGSAGTPSYAGSAGSSGSTPVAAGGGGSSGSSGSSGAGGAAGALLGSGGADPSTPVNTIPTPSNPTLPGWKLVWSDDFDAADGSAVDNKRWRHETGGNGFGNQELEFYTDDVANSEQRGGNLVISAMREGAASQSCWYGACQFTSARLVTSGKFSASYGRIEARLKIPAGKGVWPAFWMLGDDIASANWPNCGEIDIMEAIGSDPTTLHGSLHGPGYSGGSPLTATTRLPNQAKLSDDFHTYAVEWAPNSVKFFLDSTLYQTRTPADLPAGSKWVYNHSFFMILNVAVGGQWPGSPDASTTFPARMLVDYVRVYEAT
jgi:beta-glucanase (GH16 family)